MAYELIKVSELPELTTPSDPNVIPIQDGDYLKRISFENLKEAATGDVADDLAAEVTARESAVSGEATARGNADTAILADLASPYSASSTYAVGDYCIKDGQLYRCTTAISTAEAWTAAHWSAVALGNDTRDLRSALTSETEAREAADEALEESVTEILTDYAKKDGTYEDLTSGNAEQLLSDVYTENSEPYLFRKTGGADKVGSREYLDKIVGGSLVVNQKIKPSYKSGSHTWSEDVSNYFYNVYTLPTSDRFVIYSGHKYFVSVNLSRNMSGNNLMGVTIQNVLSVSLPNGAPNGIAQTIKEAPNDITASIISFNNYSGKRGFSAGDSVSYDDYQIIDLTAEFGTMIADYAYNLETATAGAGVAWLKQYIDIDSYHPYSAPTLKHVTDLQSHDIVGFNQWDGTFSLENYYLMGNGQSAVSSSGKESVTSYIPVIGGRTYYLSPLYGNASALCWYDYDKKYISGLDYRNNTSLRVTAPNNAKYIRFTVYKPNIPNICINLSDSAKNGTYEPYQKRSYPLDSSVVLRGYPMLVDGRLKFDGDEYLPSGVINRNYGIVDDMGALNFIVHDADNHIFRAPVTNMKLPSDNSDRLRGFVCEAYPPSDVSNIGASMTDKSALRNAGNVYIKDSAYSDVTSFKNSLNGKHLTFALATPSTEQAEPFRQLQICDTYGTEEFVTTSEVPVGTETRYPEDLKSKIEGLPWDLSMIAPIENGTTASQAYTVGQYFLHNNVFCKASTNIASGATFTLNTNYTETTIAAELYVALH